MNLEGDDRQLLVRGGQFNAKQYRIWNLGEFWPGRLIIVYNNQASIVIVIYIHQQEHAWFC